MFSACCGIIILAVYILVCEARGKECSDKAPRIEGYVADR
jgi:hypothetical protein